MEDLDTHSFHEWATVNLTDQLPRGNSTAVHISNTHIKER